MKIGNLVKSATAWGPDDYGPTEEYYPVGVVYRQHEQRPHRWWVQWISPGHLADIGEDRSCMLDDWLEVISASR